MGGERSRQVGQRQAGESFQQLHFSHWGSACVMRAVSGGKQKNHWQRKLITLAVASALGTEIARGAPTGPVVVSGQVGFSQQGKLLSITNTPGAIITWQSFSIGKDETTRFIQQSASSAVL